MWIPAVAFLSVIASQITLARFGETIAIPVVDVRYHNPSPITFCGLSAEGREVEPHQHMARAEQLLCEVDSAELGMLHCRQARIALARADPTAARTHLEQAEAVAGRLGHGSGSELVRSLRALQERLANPADESA